MKAEKLFLCVKPYAILKFSPLEKQYNLPVFAIGELPLREKK